MDRNPRQPIQLIKSTQLVLILLNRVGFVTVTVCSHQSEASKRNKQHAGQLRLLPGFRVKHYRCNEAVIKEQTCFNAFGVNTALTLQLGSQ